MLHFHKTYLTIQQERTNLLDLGCAKFRIKLRIIVNAGRLRTQAVILTAVISEPILTTIICPFAVHLSVHAGTFSYQASPPYGLKHSRLTESVDHLHLSRTPNDQDLREMSSTTGRGKDNGLHIASVSAVVCAKIIYNIWVH